MTKTTKPHLTESERAVCALADAGFSRLSIARKLHITKREVREVLIRSGRPVQDDGDDGDEDALQRSPRGSEPNTPSGLDPEEMPVWGGLPPDHSDACRAHLGDLVREYPNVARQLYDAARRGFRLTIADYGAAEAGRAAA